jgi:hypothetical protein
MAILCLAAVGAQADLSSGWLTSKDGGLTAAGKWALDPYFKIAWSITDNHNGTLHYEYTLSTDAGGSLAKVVSHMLLQVSDNFTLADLIQPSHSPAAGDPQTYQESDPGNSNPNLPTGIFALKFTPATTAEAGLFTFSFDSDRAAMWGNFYSKSGSNTNLATAWNKDFTTTVADPYNFTGAFDSGGHALCKIAVPDTKAPIVPAPAAIVLGVLGLGLVSRAKRYFA